MQTIGTKEILLRYEAEKIGKECRHINGQISQNLASSFLYTETKPLPFTAAINFVDLTVNGLDGARGNPGNAV